MNKIQQKYLSLCYVSSTMQLLSCYSSCSINSILLLLRAQREKRCHRVLRLQQAFLFFVVLICRGLESS